MAWKVEVFVDYREKFIKEYFEKNKEYDKIVSIKNLEIGDIVIHINDKPIILIERKTIKDLAGSIQDGRLREQKYRIASSNFPHNKIIYLIEGDIDDKVFGRIDKKTLQGSMINTMFRDDYKVYRTKDAMETVYFLSRLINKIIKDKNKIIKDNVLVKDNDVLVKDKVLVKEEDIIVKEEDIIVKEEVKDYSELIPLSKKSQMTPETFNKLILLQIPGISIRFVNEINKLYPSIKDLIFAYEKLDNLGDKENLLTEIMLDTTTGKKRKLGLVISKRIYDFINI
uniref:ERCC4 domain-containing protein n=1 Tax=viral metagenome TaxID=1070528 RepID=A0A6C0J9D8_9ZZZZ